MPLILTLPHFKQLDSRWKNFRLEVGLDSRSVHHTYLYYTFRQSLTNKQCSSYNCSLEKSYYGELFSARCKKDDILNILLSFDKLSSPLGQVGKEIPAMNGIVELVLSNTQSFRASTKGGLPNRIKGSYSSGNLSKAIFSLENGGHFDLSGPFSVSREGLLSGIPYLLEIPAQSSK
ncbi:MAG: hypothetical protein JSC085_000938 [Candidatus Tokpelaia sp. JSC085]|nr:MAG: hypothetical protein JSC085_000938 [Candidatus Tokpelaia sp. JSC085]